MKYRLRVDLGDDGSVDEVFDLLRLPVRNRLGNVGVVQQILVGCVVGYAVAAPGCAAQSHGYRESGVPAAGVGQALRLVDRDLGDRQNLCDGLDVSRIVGVDTGTVALAL